MEARTYRLTAFRLVLLSLVFFVTLGCPADQFPNLAEDYEAKAAAVRTLKTITLEKVDIRDAEIEEAVALLGRMLTANGKAGVNFILRSPIPPEKPTNPQGPFDAGKQTPPPPKKVTLRADRIDFASAVDSICQQTGHQWSIEFVAATKAITVVVSPKQP